MGDSARSEPSHPGHPRRRRRPLRSVEPSGATAPLPSAPSARPCTPIVKRNGWPAHKKSCHYDPGPARRRGEGVEAVMRPVPLTLAQANELVRRLHRHHKTVVCHRFSIGAELEGQLVGAVIVGRPAAYKTEQYRTAEVSRLVTDGTKNACSMLYQAAARAAKEIGYDRIQTFILASEPGTSLKASGWRCVGETPGKAWVRSEQRRLFADEGYAVGVKTRWMRELR